MAYAAVSDMIQRFGEREVLNNSNPEGSVATVIDVARVNQVLGDASDLIDTYLNRRYAVPLATPPASIVNACCRIARFDLAQTGGTQPTEQILSDRRDAIAWLGKIASGSISLDGIVAANVSESFSRFQSRPAPFGRGGSL